MGFHDIHASEDNCARQRGIGNLVEYRILRQVIVDGDEGGEASKRQSDEQAREFGPRVRKGRECHDAGGVYHGQLVGQLHGVFQNRLAQLAEDIGGEKVNTHLRVA